MTNISTHKSGITTNRKTRSFTAGSQPPKPAEVDTNYVSPTAESFLDAAQSAASKKAYASDIRQFAANGIIVPATVAQVIIYLAQFAGKLSVATLERRLISLHKAHLENSVECPTVHITVKRTMQGIRRTVGTKQKQARPLVKDDLLEAMVMIDRQKPVKAIPLHTVIHR